MPRPGKFHPIPPFNTQPDTFLPHFLNHAKLKKIFIIQANSHIKVFKIIICDTHINIRDRF